MARAYTKKNTEYWNRVSQSKGAVPTTTAPLSLVSLPDFQPETFGTPLYTYESTASTYSRTNSNSNPRTSRNGSRLPIDQKWEPYSNIDRYALPFEYEGGVVGARTIILQCQKAYFHIAILRNTVELMSDFANNEIWLEGGGTPARNLIKKWFKTVNLEALKSQYFREFYRSGNVFLYRLFGQFSKDELSAMKKLYASRDEELLPRENPFQEGRLPLRYIVLNPADIYSHSALTNFSPIYRKIISPFEAQRLAKAETEEDRRIFASLPEETKRLIVAKQTSHGLFIDLEPDRLISSFYKKQDYEPFAVPFGYPVLEDINWKLELKKIDQSVSRAVENCILLITAGNEPSKGGVNTKALEALKSLFSNESVGRVLVGDYTTKADFVIPDLQKVMGKEKYEIVNQDIKDGLQNILFEDGKYANNDIKTRIFLERLQEARDAFLNDFLRDEVRNVCLAVGIKDYPNIRFREFDLTDKESLNKITTRLIELGFLDAELAVRTFQTGSLPSGEEINDAQEKYVERREKGHFTPLTGAQPLAPSPDGEGASPIANIKKQNGRPAKASISKDAVGKAAKASTDFEERAVGLTKEAMKLDKLNVGQKKFVGQLCRAVVESQELKDWDTTFASCVGGKSSMDQLFVKPEILELVEKYGVDSYAAALLYHSEKI